MTLSARHRIIWILFFTSLVLNGVVFYFMMSRFSLLEGIHPLSGISQGWWFSRRGGLIPDLSSTVLLHGAAAGMTIIASLAINLSFKRSSSQEIFYFQLFLICLSFLSLRLYSYAATFYRLPFGNTVLLSRTVLFFRFSSLLFLLLSGLSVFDSRFQKNDPFFLAALIVSLCLAATIPMGNNFIQNTLTYLPANELSLFFLFLIIKLIIPINFLWFLYQRKTVDYFLLTLAALLCIAGESLLFYMSLFGFISGMISLIAGTIIFSHRIYKLYLWR